MKNSAKVNSLIFIFPDHVIQVVETRKKLKKTINPKLVENSGGILGQPWINLK